jgi:hypothetical protein
MMTEPSQPPETIVDPVTKGITIPKRHIWATINLPVMPDFRISDDGPPSEKGCYTLLINTTGDTAIEVYLDSHDRNYLNDLGRAITDSGGINATGELDFSRTVIGGEIRECYHPLAGATMEPWNPAEEQQLEVTLKSLVKPKFNIGDAGGPDDRGCLILEIQTEENEITVCVDGHYQQPLTDLGESITQAGGVKATGYLRIARGHRDGELFECDHYLEAHAIDTAEPWTPAKVLHPYEGRLWEIGLELKTNVTLIVPVEPDYEMSFLQADPAHGNRDCFVACMKAKYVPQTLFFWPLNLDAWSTDEEALRAKCKAVATAGFIKARGQLAFDSNPDKGCCNHSLWMTSFEPWEPPEVRK